MIERRHQRNQFFFDADHVRLWAYAMDYRPFLAPTGWILYIRGEDEWEIAEYGIAYSELSAQLHAEEAKSRYIRKTYYGGKYSREIKPKAKAEMRARISSESWRIHFYETQSLVEPIEEDRRKAPYEYRVNLLEKRDQERIAALRLKQRVTPAKKIKNRCYSFNQGRDLQRAPNRS
jgi:hypothetical protein